jgi:hypothetical protein
MVSDVRSRLYDLVVSPTTHADVATLQYASIGGRRRAGSSVNLTARTYVSSVLTHRIQSKALFLSL